MSAEEVTKPEDHVEELIGGEVPIVEPEEEEVKEEAEPEKKADEEPNDYEGLQGLTMEDVLKTAARNKEDWDRERERLRSESQGRLQHSRDLREENKRLRDERLAQPQPQAGEEVGFDLRFKEGSDQAYAPQESIEASVERAIDRRLAPTPEQVAWQGWQASRADYNREHQEDGVLANARADKAMGRMTELLGDDTLDLAQGSPAGDVIGALQERGHIERMVEEFPDMGRRGVEDMVVALVEMQPFKVKRMLDHFLPGEDKKVDGGVAPVLRKPRDDARSPASRGSSDEGPGKNIEQRAAELSAKNPMDLTDEEYKELNQLNRRIERAS